jgi:AcrR family transcriptional regulator
MARRDAEENREAILAAARVELNRDPDASVDSIAAAAGLSRRAVYGHFATRDDLLRAVVTIGTARVTAAFDVDPHPDPVIDLCLIAVTLWHEVEGVRVMSLFAVRGPFKQQTAHALSGVRARARDDIRRGQSSGDIRTDMSVRTLAHLLEEGILSVLDEAVTDRLDSAAVHGLVLRVVLALLGLGWRDAEAFLSTTPELERREL